LPKDRPCIAIEPHGFDGAEPPRTIEEMAAQRLKTVLEIQTTGPYYLGGFCNGGLVAFHIAQMLRAQGKEVACVVLLGANGINVQFRNLKRLATLVARARGMDPAGARDLFLKWRERSLFGGLLVRHHLKELAPHPSLIWVKARSFARWLLRLAGLRSSLTPSAAAAEAQNAEEESGMPPIWNIYSDAVAAYVPSPYDGKLILIRETELPPELAWMGDDMGWSKVARRLLIDKIPGGHFTITEHSNIRIFAEQLKACMEEVEAEIPPAKR
jgi:thioesterase domain-containing protein